MMFTYSPKFSKPVSSQEATKQSCFTRNKTTSESAKNMSGVAHNVT